MKLEKDHFYVTGNYFLRTTGDQSIVLYYPFPADSLYGEVDTLTIYNLTAGNPVDMLERKTESAVFRVNFEGNPEIELLIAYRQKLLGNKAEYILETTASWKKPFEQADYQLIVPAEMEITVFSIPPDNMMDAGKEKIYYWSRKNYMPASNMIFEFTVHD